jgi:hypothetical protein
MAIAKRQGQGPIAYWILAIDFLRFHYTVRLASRSIPSPFDTPFQFMIASSFDNLLNWSACV